MNEALITGIFTVLAAAVTGVTTWLVGRTKVQKLEGQLSQAEHFLAAEAEAMKFEHQFAASARIRDQFQALCEQTEVDRILLLIAWNGVAAPKWTKAIYQFRMGEQEVTEYIHTELDDDYRMRLVEIQDSPNGKVYRVEEMAEHSLIRQIYDAERVKSSLWVFLRARAYDDGTCYSYLSFSSHHTESISPDVRTRVRLLVNQIRSQAC